MSAALRKGWCPGALRPMAAADGLIVRLRLTGGILPAATADVLADLATRHGNGHFDLSARANLQIRGIGEHTLPALIEALGELGLVDADASAEAVRNVMASPLAGLHDGPDVRPLVAALEARLAGTRDLHRLPTKFGFLVDDGSRPSLADVSADVRFDWIEPERTFAVGLGGTSRDALRIGICGMAELVGCAEAVARGALALFARAPEVRRVRGLIEVLGAGAVLEACEARVSRPPALSEAGTRASSSVLPPDVLALAAPYGRLDSAMLRVAATIAQTGRGELRLTPFRSLLVPGVSADGEARRHAGRAGFMMEEEDSRHAVAACVGLPECERATTATRADADALAELAAALGDGPTVHVSGCAKGCAHAGPARVTLVGRDGRYDLVRDGRAGDRPVRHGLDIAAARAAIAALGPA